MDGTDQEFITDALKTKEGKLLLSDVVREQMRMTLSGTDAEDVRKAVARLRLERAPVGEGFEGFALTTHEVTKLIAGEVVHVPGGPKLILDDAAVAREFVYHYLLGSRMYGGCGGRESDGD
jgi:hypothetical protein